MALAPLATALPTTATAVVVLALALGITLAWMAHLFADRKPKPY